MSAEQVAEQIQRVDRALNNGQAIAASDKSINLTTLYRRYGWSRGGATTLPAEALAKLKLTDRTGDPRWMAYFNKSAKQLGVYRTMVGFYWILRYEPMLNEHYLDHGGSAADIEAKYGG